MEDKQYKAMWKYSNRKGTNRGDFLSPNLRELLRILNKSEGVSTGACDEIVIHEILGGGKIAEVYSFDRKTGEVAFDYNVQTQQVNGVNAENVVSIVDAAMKKQAAKEENKIKPHIKLSLDPTKKNVRPFVAAAYGRYRAYEA